MSPVLVFFSRLLWLFGVLLWFYTNFMIFCSISMKNAIGILIWVALNLLIALGSVDNLTILILSIFEHGIALHLFVSSISFSNACSFQYTGLYFLG